MYFLTYLSFQLAAAQEVSTMVREGLNPIIFVLSNDGYEIERQIHGPERRYNNTARWNFKSFCDTFNDVNKVDDVTVGGLNKDSNGDFKKSHVDDVPQSKIEYFAIKTKEDMDKLLSDQSFAHSKALRFVEVFVSRGDAPKALLGQANS
jgi:pyruvate decarboxylase